MRYFLAALLAGPGRLQRFPLFALAALALVVLAVVHSPLWLIALVGVTALVATLANNARFRKVVDSRGYESTPAAGSEDEYEALSSQLKLEARSRLRILERKRDRILEQQRGAGTDEYLLEQNRFALQQLLRIFAQLLLTRQELLTEDVTSEIERAQSEIVALEKELAIPDVREEHVQSLRSTLQLKRERVKILLQRSQKLEEIASDVHRIEAHFDLALSQAGDREKPQGITADIGLASEGLHTDLSSGIVDQIEESGTTSSPTRSVAE